jgi:DNA polymerase III alpha subunit
MQYQPLFNLFPDLNMITPSQLQEQQVGSRVVVAGVVEAREMKTTKKGDPFLRMRVGDQMGNIEVMVWSPLATQVFNRVPDNSMALITGTIQEDKFRLGENTIYVNGVTPISNGIPINSYYAADVPTANTVALQIGGEIATLSDQIMNMGHVVMLKNIAFIRPNDFAGLATLRARYQING